MTDPGIIDVPSYIDLAAVVVGAFSGATHAARKNFDVIGVLVLAVVMGVGGGIIRDLLLGVAPPVALTNTAFLPTAACAAIVGAFFAGLLTGFKPLIFLLDAAALALFMVVGVEKALLYGVPAGGAVFVGVAAAVGGSLLRDVFSGDPPEVMRQGPWNAAAALAGASLYVVIRDQLDVDRVVAEIIALLLCFGLRMLSVWRGWETPMTHDLTPVVTRPIRRVTPAVTRPIRRVVRRDRDDRGGAT